MLLHMKMEGDSITPRGGTNIINHLTSSICKVENWMKSCGETNCSRSQIKVCLTPTATRSKKRLKSKSKSSVVSGKSEKTVKFKNEKVSSTLRSSSMVQPSKSSNIHVHTTHTASFPIQTTTHLHGTERPLRSCSCISNTVTNRDRCVHGYLQFFNPYPMLQVAKRMSNTRLMLSGLKSEINKVKSQLNNISVATRNTTLPQASQDTLKKEKEINQLRLENLQLKKELDLKNQQCSQSLKDVEKAKEILTDYEKKVLSLHDQAMKSSKLIKQSKDKFCKCLKEKETDIQKLKENNEYLVRNIKEKENKFETMNSEYEILQSSFQESSNKLLSLTEESKNFTECIKFMQVQLENAGNETQNYKEEIKKLEEQILNYECKLCQKLEAKAKKQKVKLNNRIKEQEQRENMLMEKISELSNQLEATKEIEMAHQKLQDKCKDLETELEKQEEYVNKYKILEQKYKQDCDNFRETEESYNKDREQLKNLVDELTLVVKQNKVTLLQLSAINKQQESLLTSQTSLISEKDDKLKLVESEVEVLKKRSIELEEEVRILRMSLEEPCKHESHLKLMDQLREIRTNLDEEMDKQLIKEKIIEDQSQTIAQLQRQVNEKITELNRAREKNNIAEEEIMIINGNLLKTHKELEEQVSKKELLNKKFHDLQKQNSTLSVEVSELEELIHQKLETDQKQQMEELQEQIKLLRSECEAEKTKLRIEKSKAVEAAQFATQKLLDTVNDFQKQVGAQKKVQYLLTKMLHDKEEDLKKVHKRLNSINSLTVSLEREFPVNEIFKSNLLDLSDPNTTSSFISSCSPCSRQHCCCGRCQKTIKPQVLDIFITDEEPSKD